MKDTAQLKLIEPCRGFSGALFRLGPGCFLAALGVLIAVLSTPSLVLADARPHLKLESQHFKAPLARVGDYVKHDFIFYNTGSAILKVSRVTTGCHCTVASYDKEVQPGGSGKVTLVVQADERWAGRRVTQSAIMMTNDPKVRRARLTLEVEVAKP